MSTYTNSQLLARIVGAIYVLTGTVWFLIAETVSPSWISVLALFAAGVHIVAGMLWERAAK